MKPCLSASCGLGSFAGNTSDDYTYLQHVLEAVEKLQPVDRARVFVSGFSMGGYASNALACKHPEMFRAIAPASGGAPPGPCAGEVVPVMLFHGTNDGTIAHDCGVQARKAWAAHNGCSSEVDSVAVLGGTCEWSRGCPQGGQVVFCSYQGMGHGWAGSINPFALGGTQFESATTLMWSFFEDYL
jgi:poly(3-hydroxybutyrate) depolymerase